MEFIHPEDVDDRLGWPRGRAERLARQRRLPYILLPDGSVRFVWDQIAGLLVSVQSTSFAPEVSIAREGGVP